MTDVDAVLEAFEREIREIERSERESSPQIIKFKRSFGDGEEFGDGLLIPTGSDTIFTEVHEPQGVALDSRPTSGEDTLISSDSHEASGAPVPPTQSPESSPAESTKATSAYRFPFDDPEVTKVLVEIDGESTHTLLQRVDKLFARNPVTGLPYPYNDIRAAACAISLRLNQLGERAPYFRPIRKQRIAAGIKATQEQSDLSNDLQVIDLDWLAHNARERICPTGKASEIFTATGLDFERASRFIKTRGKVSDKVAEIGVSEPDELMLAVIRMRETGDRHRTISEGEVVARQKLVNHANRDSSRIKAMHIPAYMEEYKALRMARGQLKTAARMLRELSGRSIRSSELSRRKSWFNDLGIPTD